jgi:hypothetical protein
MMWATVFWLISVSTTAILTFTQLVTAPLDARLWIVGAAATIMSLGVLVFVRRANWLSRSARRVIGAVAATVLPVLIVWVLSLTVAYHSILVTRSGSGQSGTVILHAARFPTETTVFLGVSSQEERIDEFHPGFRRAAGSTPWGVEKDRPTAKTLALHQFSYPQTFGIDYRMAIAHSNLTLDSAIVPATITRVDSDEFDRIMFWVWLLGGFLWVSGLAFSLWRF